MEVELLFPGSYCMGKISLKRGEKISAQSDAMVSMSNTLKLESSAKGGIFGALKRTLSGEALFMQTISAESGDGEVFVAPGETGDLAVLELTGSNGYILQKGAFLAADETVKMDMISQGIMKGIFSREGFFLQEASGTGKLVISSFGGIYKKTLAPGEEWTVDNGHMVAWEKTINYEIGKASSGWMSSFLSGEGIVCKLKGPGDVYIQSRNPASFGAWIRTFMPVKTN